MANGNFGRKRESRGTKVENVSAELKSKGRFRYLQSTGEITWTALKKHPWLRPFAWIIRVADSLRGDLWLCSRTRGSRRSWRMDWRRVSIVGSWGYEVCVLEKG